MLIMMLGPLEAACTTMSTVTPSSPSSVTRTQTTLLLLARNMKRTRLRHGPSPPPHPCCSPHSQNFNHHLLAAILSHSLQRHPTSHTPGLTFPESDSAFNRFVVHVCVCVCTSVCSSFNRLCIRTLVLLCCGLTCPRCSFFFSFLFLLFLRRFLDNPVAHHMRARTLLCSRCLFFLATIFFFF